MKNKWNQAYSITSISTLSYYGVNSDYIEVLKRTSLNLFMKWPVALTWSSPPPREWFLLPYIFEGRESPETDESVQASTIPFWIIYPLFADSPIRSISSIKPYKLNNPHD